VTLPDNVCAALQDAGISEDEMLLMTGDELVGRVGAKATYELAAALAKDGRAFAHFPGRRGRISTDPELRERNVEILRLRLVEGMYPAAIGREVGVTRTRVTQLLHHYFGINKKLLRVRSITIPVEALAVVREAMRTGMLSAVEDLRVCLTTGVPDIDDEWERLSMAHDLLRRTDSDDDVEVYLGRKFGAVLADALRSQLAVERHLAAEDGRHGEDAAAIERLLTGMP